ncbi:MAG: hypothetical protein EOM26_12680 [Alphaproteobacteria bacterium]|nr:hypothetical protein [Alphaproteobacteria bacterium]
MMDRKRTYNDWMVPCAILATILTMPGLAYASLGDAIQNTVESSSLMPGLFSGASYLFGIVLGVLGIGKVWEHVQSPSQVPIWEALRRFIAGSGFLALPMVLEAAYNTLALGLGTPPDEALTATTSAGGLDRLVALLVSDIVGPMRILIAGFCYAAGIVLIMVGISRLMKTMQDGIKGPGGIGTIMTFLVGGALLSVETIIGVFSESIFTTNNVTMDGTLSYTQGMTAEEVNHVHAVIDAVIVFMAIVGWVSIVRGIFILRAVAEGDQQASLMASFTHMFGGALAVNLGPLLNAIQDTLQISAYGLVFS